MSSTIKRLTAKLTQQEQQIETQAQVIERLRRENERLKRAVNKG